MQLPFGFTLIRMERCSSRNGGVRTGSAVFFTAPCTLFAISLLGEPPNAVALYIELGRTPKLRTSGLAEMKRQAGVLAQSQYARAECATSLNPRTRHTRRCDSSSRMSRSVGLSFQAQTCSV
jgi:hypothetical protein